MSCGCGCCDGGRAHTPLDLANAPGHRELRYRLGEHGDFLRSMMMGLSAQQVPALAGLRTRDPADPAIALLDAGATLLDVLTFYQERIANEGYLRTAVERRSLVEMARLVGYRPRPGLSASVFLAFTVEQSGRLTIPAGTRAQSVPGQDELPQSFETSSPLDARAEWNELNVRKTRPQITLIPFATSGKGGSLIYLKGVSTGLRTGDPLLVKVPAHATPRVYRVMNVTVDRIAERTRLEIQLWRSSTLTETVRTIALSLLLLGAPSPASDISKAAVEILQALAKTASDNDVDEEKVANITAKARDRLIELAAKLEQNPDLSSKKDDLSQWLKAAIMAFEDSLADFDVDSVVQERAISNKSFDFGAAAAKAALPQSIGPRSSASLPRDLGSALASRSAATLGLIGRFQPTLRESIPALLRNARVAPDVGMQVFALRSRASLFGHNAPLKLKGFEGNVPVYQNWDAGDIHEAEDESNVHLDAKYETVTPGSWVVIDTGAVPLGLVADTTGVASDEKGTRPRPARFPILVAQAVTVHASESRHAYGISGPSTNIELTDPWLLFGTRNSSLPHGLAISGPTATGSEGPFDVIRRTSVFATSELLELAEAPIETPLCDGTDANSIELADLQQDLTPGRWVIITGERTDVPGTSGITGAELRMIAEVRHDVARMNGSPLGGELSHTFLSVSSPLLYCYDRSTVKIWGNVVAATHGETRRETLGNGNGAEPFQRFTLKASPLTYTAAATFEGTASSLEVRVNEVRWRELAVTPPTDHGYVSRTTDDGKTTLMFGDGKNGARLPTGRENVRATYRTGIGRAGNVGAGRISLLASKPIGLKDVTNPLRSSGGADADSIEQLRSNIPVALEALDRLVSVRDYADFARSFAGIGKASATRLSNGREEVVHVTIAGVDDIPILESSDLFANLSRAFMSLGDVRQPVRLAVRELVMLIIAARVRVAPDYRWDLVEPHVRAALFDTFGFDRRELGQSATSSEVLATIQQVPGVEYVDLDTFGGVPEFVPDAGPPASRRPITPDKIATLVKDATDPATAAARVGDCSWLPPFCPVPARLAGPDENGVIAPAQIVLLTPDVPGTLVLNAIQ